MRVVIVVPQPGGFQNEAIILESSGAGYVAAAAAGAGHESILLDQADPRYPTEDLLVDAAIRLAPDVLGLSMSTCASPLGLRIAARVKKATGCTVIAGGVHVTNAFQEVLQDQSVDIVVRGEGERTLVSILAALGSGSDLETIPGLALRGEDNNAFLTPDPPRIQDLDGLPWPMRSPSHDGYRFRGLIAGGAKVDRVRIVSGSRDCPHQCLFCAPQYPGARCWISRSVEGILDETEPLVRDHGTQYILFCDPSFGHITERVEALCDGILSRGLRFLWGCEIRVTDVTPDLARLMSRAGCVFSSVGIDSGTEETLRRLRKGMRTDHIRNGTKALFDASIEVHGNLIIGFPWDDAATIRDSMDFYFGLPLDVFGLNYAVPFHGTPLHRMAIDEDLIFDFDLSHWTARWPVMRTRHLDREALEDLYRGMTRSYYLRPGYAGHVARRLVQRPGRIFDYAGLAADFLHSLRLGGSRIRGE
jgi:radical SAM superfamily enzyme YgiQ (UPF0313 family)